jgi:protein involved in polysaccharide export with SLBB domain
MTQASSIWSWIKTAFVVLGLAVAAPVAAQDASAPVAPAAPPPAVSSDSYRPQIGDMLRVTVFNQPEFSGDFTVDANGMISVPIIGEIQSVGRTASEVAMQITSKLKPDYLTDPRVSVLIASFRPIIVLGEVNRPGSYDFRQGMTVIDAIGLAGGFTYRANEKRILARPATAASGSERPTKPEAQIQPGEVITVKQRFF